MNNLFKIIALIAVIIGGFASFVVFKPANADTIETESNAMIQSENKVFEMRTYTTHEGKLDDLHERFENHTMEFFEKHGMTNIGYWVPEDAELKDNTLIYILAHDSREAARESWESFSADPDWQEVFQESRVDGPIVNNIVSVFMKSTPYSQIQ